MYMEEGGAFPSSFMYAASHGVGLTILKAYAMVGWDFFFFGWGRVHNGGLWYIPLLLCTRPAMVWVLQL